MKEQQNEEQFPKENVLTKGNYVVLQYNEEQNLYLKDFKYDFEKGRIDIVVGALFNAHFFPKEEFEKIIPLVDQKKYSPIIVHIEHKEKLSWKEIMESGE